MPFKLTVQISANARKNEIIGWQGDRLKIKIKAPAVEGKANDELLRFLAKQSGVHRREITIEHGATSTTKLIAFHAIDKAAFCERMGLADHD